MSTTLPNGLLPRPSSSPSESGTCRIEGVFDGGFRALVVALPSLSGGGGARCFRLNAVGADASYSTEVLRGTLWLVRDVETQELLGLV